MPAMARILFIVCMLVAWGGAAALEPSSSPSVSPGTSPSGDCVDVVYDLADCFNFLINGSNETKTSSDCCSGFESVVKTNVQCICEAVRSSHDLGLDLNVTRAITLSSVCGISAPSITACSVTPPSPLPPKKSPAPAPSLSPSESPAPAPSSHPNNGAAYNTADASITVVIISMLVVALFSVISV